MVQPMGKAKMKAMLKELDSASEYDAWRKAQPLDDEDAARIDAFAEEVEGLPHLRELDGYLFLDAGDGEHIYTFQDTRGTRRELIGQILSSLPKEE